MAIIGHGSCLISATFGLWFGRGRSPDVLPEAHDLVQRVVFVGRARVDRGPVRLVDLGFRRAAQDVAVHFLLATNFIRERHYFAACTTAAAVAGRLGTCSG